MKTASDNLTTINTKASSVVVITKKKGNIYAFKPIILNVF